MKKRHELSASEVDELLDHLLRRLEGLGVPSLPEVAVKILELTEDPDSSFKDFAEVIRSDQALTGKLLRMANSAFFAQSREVTSIERAMVLIGLQRLKALVLGFHLATTAGSSPGVGLRQVWTQSVFRGWLAHELAQRINGAIRGEAFVVGLMADAGLPLMPVLLGPTYEQTVDPGLMPSRRFTLEQRELPYTHVDVAAAMCTLWNFPESLARPIRLHHDPLPSMNPRDPESALRATAYMVGALDLNDDPDQTASARMPGVAVKLLQIDAAETAAALSDAQCAFQASRELFGPVLDESIDAETLLQRANGQLSAQLEAALGELSARDEGQAEVLRVGELVYEVRSGRDGLRITILDAAGVPLFEERLDPDGLDDQQLRYDLLLDAAADGDARQVIDVVRRLAA